MDQSLILTCFGCGCERSRCWLWVTGKTKPDHPRGGDNWARTLLCADCEISRADELATFIDGLADGWTGTRDIAGVIPPCVMAEVIPPRVMAAT